MQRHKAKTLQFGRPRLLETMWSSRLVVANLSLNDSPFWTLHLWASQHVFVTNVTVNAIGGPNTDGFDPDSSSDVLVTNSAVYNGDDCISVKSGMDEAGRSFGRPSQRIRFENIECAFGDGVALGSEMSGGIQDVSFVGISLRDSAHGLYLKTSNQRGGYIRNITFSDVTQENTGDMIRFWTDYGNNFGLHVPRIDSFSFVNISGSGRSCGELSCSLLKPCTRIDFENVNFKCTDGFTCSHVSGSVKNVTPAMCF